MYSHLGVSYTISTQGTKNVLTVEETTQQKFQSIMEFSFVLFRTAISYVKSVDSEWDDYLLSYILLGGNTLFINSLEKMKVNPELSVEEKYRTYALDYYRRNLKNKVMNGSEIPIEKNEKAEEVNINNTIEKKKTQLK